MWGSARTYEGALLKIDRRRTKNGTSKQIQLLRKTDVYAQVKSSIIARKLHISPGPNYESDMVPLSRESVTVLMGGYEQELLCGFVNGSV